LKGKSKRAIKTNVRKPGQKVWGRGKTPETKWFEVQPILMGTVVHPCVKGTPEKPTGIPCADFGHENSQ